MSDKVQDMTIEELIKLIDERVARLLKESQATGTLPDQKPESVEALLAAIDEHMWTPPPGAKSSQELLREDRDR